MQNQIIRSNPEASALIPEIWSANLYEVLLASLVFRASIDDSYEGEIQDLGDRVNINTVPEFDDAEVLPEDQNGDADKVTVSQQQLIVNKRVYKDFIITKKALMQSIPFMDKLQEHAAYAIMKKVEKIIIDSIVPSVGNQLTYVTGTTLAFADILAAKEKLDAANVPMADRSMVVGSAQLNDIYNITDFKSSDFIISGAPVVTGELPPALLGFRPAFTTLVGDTSFYMHKSFLTIASQRGMSVAEYDLGINGARASRVNADVLFGLQQLDGNRVVTIVD